MTCAGLHNKSRQCIVNFGGLQPKKPKATANFKFGDYNRRTKSADYSPQIWVRFFQFFFGFFSGFFDFFLFFPFWPILTGLTGSVLVVRVGYDSFHKKFVGLYRH